MTHGGSIWLRMLLVPLVIAALASSIRLTIEALLVAWAAAVSPSCRDKDVVSAVNCEDKAAFPAVNCEDKAAFPAVNCEDKAAFPAVNCLPRSAFPAAEACCALAISVLI